MAAPCTPQAGLLQPHCSGLPQGMLRYPQHYSHHALAAPACPAVPHRPSHPFGPAGQTDVTHAVSHAPWVGSSRSWHPSEDPEGSCPRCRARTHDWTYLLSIGASWPRESLRGNSRAKWVSTGGLVQVPTGGHMQVPTESSPQHPQPRVHMRWDGRGAPWCARAISRASLTVSPRCPFSPCGPSAH